MKIYERPSVEIKRFDVEDIMAVSGEFAAENGMFNDITNNGSQAGVVFEW